MQTQQTRRLQVLPVQVVALAIGLLVALMLAGSFGFWLKGLSVSPDTKPAISIGAVGREQIAHNRSEAGLGAPPSIGGEQIKHNRSEENFGT